MAATRRDTLGAVVADGLPRLAKVLFALGVFACRGGTSPGGATEARAAASPPSIPAHREIELAGQRLSYRVECQTDDECAVGWLAVDCCGTQRAVGVRKDARLDLEERVSRLRGHAASCECLASPTTLDNGALNEDPRLVDVACVEGACMTASAKTPSDTSSPPSLETSARTVESAPFTACTAKVRPLPLQGVELHPLDLPTVGDNLVYAPERSGGSRSALIDAAKGRHLASFGGVYHGEARLQRAVVAAVGSDVQELLDLVTGARIRPSITTPSGAPRSWRIALDGHTGTVWLLARVRDDTAYFGVWPEPRSAPVWLEQTLPFWPEAVSDGDGVLVTAGDQSCLLGPGGARCFPALLHANVIGGRYVVSPSSDAIYDAELEEDVSVADDCDWKLVATLHDPPRALFSCKREGRVEWLVWSPEAKRARFESGDWLAAGGSKLDTRVVPLELLVDPAAAVEHWFDLLLARIVVTPPLVPLVPQQRFGSRIVVESNEERGGLHLLDVETATLTTIVPEADCEQLLCAPSRWN